MKHYEILYIVNPNFERKKVDDTMKEIESRLKKTKSKVINHIIWGKKKLAYPIQEHRYGTYVLVHCSVADNSLLDEFNSWLKLSDLVIRHMIIRLDDEPEEIEKIDDKLNLEPSSEGQATEEATEEETKEETKEATEEETKEETEEATEEATEEKTKGVA